MSRSAKRMRKFVRKIMRTDLAEAWESMRILPLKNRINLAWRLLLARGMDGQKVRSVPRIDGMSIPPAMNKIPQ